MNGKPINKQDTRRQLSDGRVSAVQRYRDFFVGRDDLSALLKYEVTCALASPCPGALGYVLRKILFPDLFRTCGRGGQFGKNLSVRHPSKIDIGKDFAIDNDCLLDARGVEEGGFKIGDRVMIARGTSILAKTDHGSVSIGNDCVIGRDCVLTSTGGIEVGSSVGIGDQTFIGGGRYQTSDSNRPMIKQEMFTEGPVVIGDDCWIGIGARIMDGVTIGHGSIIGAGAIIREDVPECTVVTPTQRLIKMARVTEEDNGVADFEDELEPPKAHAASVGIEQVLASVYRAIDALNQTLPSERRIERSPETALNERLSSLNKVNLIVETEMAIEEDFGQTIDLADQSAVAEGKNLFDTVGSFSSYVESLLKR